MGISQYDAAAKDVADSRRFLFIAFKLLKDIFAFPSLQNSSAPLPGKKEIPNLIFKFTKLQA